MKFLIQHNIINIERLEVLKKALCGFPHEFIGVIPFTHDLTSDEPLDGTDYITYGSTLLTEIAHAREWVGVHFDLDKFNYRQAAKHRVDMLNNEQILTVKDVVEFMKGNQGRDWFVRPSHDLKHFVGQVIDAKECADWFLDAMSLPPESGTYYIPEDMEIVVAEPKNIDSEYRWFVVDGKIVNGAMYRNRGKLCGEPVTNQELIGKAQDMANGWLPDRCVVMDTAVVGEDHYVVEFNCINSSGVYGHDVREIIEALWNYHN
jgi:hypothetical protein